MAELALYPLTLLLPLLMHWRFLSRGVGGRKRRYSGILASFPLLFALGSGLAATVALTAFLWAAPIIGYIFAALGALCFFADGVCYLDWALGQPLRRPR